MEKMSENKWQYKLVKLLELRNRNISDYEDKLNKLGKKGWEAVGFTSTSKGRGSLKGAVLFKKPRK